MVSGIDYKEGKAVKAKGTEKAKPGTLESQTKESLKKFIGKPNIKVDNNTESIFVTREELTLFMNNRKKRQGGEQEGGN